MIIQKDRVNQTVADLSAWLELIKIPESWVREARFGIYASGEEVNPWGRSMPGRDDMDFAVAFTIWGAFIKLKRSEPAGKIARARNDLWESSVREHNVRLMPGEATLRIFRFRYNLADVNYACRDHADVVRLFETAMDLCRA